MRNLDVFCLIRLIFGVLLFSAQTPVESEQLLLYNDRLTICLEH